MNKGDYKMDNYTATELAYKNGYDDGFKAGVTELADLIREGISLNCTLVDVYDIIDTKVNGLVNHE